MKTFQLATILRILETAKNAEITQVELTNKLILSLVGSENYKQFAVDRVAANRLASAVRPFSKDIRRIVRSTSFDTIKERINDNILPLLMESEFDKVEKSIRAFLKDDESVLLETHIGPIDDSFTKKSILTSNSLSFLDLLSGTLYYVAINSSAQPEEKNDLRSYIKRMLARTEQTKPCPLSEDDQIDLLEAKEDSRFSTVEETKKLLKLGEKLHKLFRNSKSSAELVSKIRWRDILEEIKKNLPNDCKIDEQSFDSIYSSIIDFYKSNDEVSYCGIVIGIYIKEMYYCEHFPKIYSETELIQDISNLPQNIILNPEKLQSQIQEIGHLDIENIQEQIANYLVDQYSEKTQLTSAVENAEHLYGIIDFLSQNCPSLSVAKRTLSILIKESQAVSNHYSKNILEKFNATMNDLLEDQYSKYIKYRVWPFAIWEDVELFEIICMDNIEIIARSSANRQEALKVAEQSINLFKILNAERDIQILSRVAYEFAAASDEEYDMLKNQLED